ncbi:hypothetical protein ACKVWL_003436, partial [Pyricularia oryzae]
MATFMRRSSWPSRPNGDSLAQRAISVISEQQRNGLQNGNLKEPGVREVMSGSDAGGRQGKIQ